MDERIWTDSPLGPDEVLRIGATEIKLAPRPAQACLITGDLAKALVILAPDAPCIGLGDKAADSTSAIRIGRDSALLVLSKPLMQPMGWQAEGFALSDASDVYTPISFSGGAPEALLAQGTAASLKQGSPSAALLFAGQTALLIRNAEGYVLWVQSASLCYITAFLKGLAA